DREPQVVVIGAGHTGLALGARLRELGIDTLLVEKTPRVGDVWRNRYAALALHDPIGMDHMPYLQFPATWPRFTPKDRFANFLEYYSQALDLNVWTGSTVDRIEHSKKDERWEVV